MQTKDDNFDVLIEIYYKHMIQHFIRVLTAVKVMMINRYNLSTALLMWSLNSFVVVSIGLLS